MTVQTDPPGITPGTWPQVLVVASFLFLWALPALAIHPTLRKDTQRVTAYWLITAALVIPTSLTALNMAVFAGWAALGLLLYVAFLGLGVALSIKARRQYRRIKRQRRQDDEVVGRMTADIKRNGPTL